jgi:hypothetical protein
MVHGNGQWHCKGQDRVKKVAGISLVTNEYTNKQHLGWIQNTKTPNKDTLRPNIFLPLSPNIQHLYYH